MRLFKLVQTVVNHLQSLSLFKALFKTFEESQMVLENDNKNRSFKKMWEILASFLI